MLHVKLYLSDGKCIEYDSSLDRDSTAKEVFATGEVFRLGNYIINPVQITLMDIQDVPTPHLPTDGNRGKSHCS